MMKLKHIYIKQLTNVIDEYTIYCRYGSSYELEVSFIYNNSSNIIFPGHIFLYDIRTLWGGIVYINSKKWIYDNHIRRIRENFPELSKFSDIILKHIEKYCGIYNPKIICDLDKVEVNL